MRGADWRFLSESITRLSTGWEDDSVSRMMSELLRESITMDSFVRIWRAIREWDVTAMLDRVACPTLLLPRRGDWAFGEELAREMAVAIPDATTVFVDAKTNAERTAQILRAITAFLGGMPTSQDAARPSWPAIIATASVAAAPPNSSFRTESLPAQTPANPDALTPREIEVLRLIAAGRTNLEISSELVLSLRTVARHITNIYGKIGARSKVDAASYAMRHGLTPEA
jgi:DNA-binding NarL/FixJ family response regulator